MEIRPNGSLRLHTFPIDIPQDQGFISFYNALSEVLHFFVVSCWFCFVQLVYLFYS